MLRAEFYAPSKNSFSCVPGVMAPRHLSEELQGAFRTRLHAGILHLLRSQGKRDGSSKAKKEKKYANLIKAGIATVAKYAPRET